MEHMIHACCAVGVCCLIGGCAMLFLVKRDRHKAPTHTSIEGSVVLCKRCVVAVDVIKEPGTGKFVAVCPQCKSAWPLAE